MDEFLVLAELTGWRNIVLWICVLAMGAIYVAAGRNKGFVEGLPGRFSGIIVLAIAAAFINHWLGGGSSQNEACNDSDYGACCGESWCDAQMTCQECEDLGYGIFLGVDSDCIDYKCNSFEAVPYDSSQETIYSKD